ncbi:uncharacterized protein KY384_002813 [Bacidia gigantensis]|uniref:uncharacterized protein n=1 Tax=Bacidia gigantensis TaxID=2732470 RepID=UPI001D04DEF0|nr:uncharacterized protein KY384_002813 [Bacidia gigantensis]KAG8532935.1 hypothetical protein KY384_002813 [Bacidia gigantensis]
MEEVATDLSGLQLGDDVASDRKILIAVDFAIQCSLTTIDEIQSDVQTIIQQWPDPSSGGLEGVSSDKVPTELRYDGNSCKWGFQVDDFGPRHQWFKLDLDPSQSRGVSDLAQQYPDQHALPPDYDASAEKLCTDYLSALRTHTEKLLQHKLPASIIKSTPLEYIITVPAVWSDNAQAKTRFCAFEAGMGKDLQIISEPEAAAIYALHAMDPHSIKEGDTFVLCDAGGGTVDLISYTVTALKPILKVQEAATGSGRLCGSTFLNRIFQKYLVDKLSLNEEWDEEVVEDAMKRFDLVTKKAFRGDVNEEFIIPVPGLADDPANSVRRGKFKLPGTVVKNTIFDPVVSEVLALVNGQIAATKAASLSVKAVLLVGGFGQSPYLRETLRSTLGPSIEVMQPPNGWTAVVRGALMKGLAALSPSTERVKVAARVARKHYGTEIMSKYDPSGRGHSRTTAWWDDYDGELKVFDMSWFITKGSEVTEDQSFTRKYHKVWKVSEGPRQTVAQDIMMFEDLEGKGAPVYKDGADVRQLARLRADLSCIPVGELMQRAGKDGKVC